MRRELGRVTRSASTAAVMLLAFASCTPTRHTLSPYREDPVPAALIEQEAATRCRDRRRPMPPTPFTTDGCSLWPDGSWGSCCLDHDMTYWCGGGCADRTAADHALQACVAAQGHPYLGATMFLGTQLGGPPLMPTPWRWSYGWPWPHGYDDDPAPPAL